jgi:adenylate cyclase
MGIEIERKFLVPGNYPGGTKQHAIKQGYINPALCTVIIRDNKILFKDKEGILVYQLNVGSDGVGILKDIKSDKYGLLILDDYNIARIRIRDIEGFVTLKGEPNAIGTPEYEYSIPIDTAEELLKKFTTGYIIKTRHIIPHGGKIWEVDEFLSPIKLTLAEIELSDINEKIDIPSWVGQDVTDQRKYHNSEIMKMNMD